MSSRGDKRSGRQVERKDDGFHAPFRELADTLEERRKAAAKAAKKAARAALVSAAPAAAASPAPAPQRPRTDQEAFAEATAGVSRLTPAPSVRRTFQPDLDRIGSRQADLDAMAQNEGFDLSFHDHYVRGRASGVSRETLAQLERGAFAVSVHLDLHGMNFEDARIAVDDFLREEQRRGHRCVLIVTGKGKNSPRQQGVLRERVPEWLARGPSARRVLAFVTARPCDGGLGALYVLMRSSSSRKNRIRVESGGVGGLER